MTDITLPRRVTIYSGKRVYTDTAPPELVDQHAIATAIKHLEARIEHIAPFDYLKGLKKEYETDLADLKCAVTGPPPKPPKESGKGKGGEKGKGDK
jgi:hypothetical protein